MVNYLQNFPLIIFLKICLFLIRYNDSEVFRSFSTHYKVIISEKQNLFPKRPPFDLMRFDLKGSLFHRFARTFPSQSFTLPHVVTRSSSLNDSHKNLWIRANVLHPSTAVVLTALVRGSLITVGTYAKGPWLGFGEKLLQRVLFLFVFTFKMILKSAWHDLVFEIEFSQVVFNISLWGFQKLSGPVSLNIFCLSLQVLAL